MDDLKNKIDLIKDEHAAATVDQKGREFEEKRITETAFFLGRVKQIDHDARSIAAALTAQTIRALEHFQENGMYKSLGFATFVDFLEKSEYSPMSKRQYYERRELMNAHGDEVYDLLTSVGISVRSQKLLGSGDLAIKGDRLVIGETEVDVANTGVIKDVLNELFDDRRALQEKAARDAKKIADQADQIDKGVRENEQLARNLDSLQSSNPHDVAFMRAIGAIGELTEIIGQTLADERKAATGSDRLPILNTAMQRVRAAYGTNFSFTEAAVVSEDDLLREMAREVNNTVDDGEDD